MVLMSLLTCCVYGFNEPPNELVVQLRPVIGSRDYSQILDPKVSRPRFESLEGGSLLTFLNPQFPA